MDLKHTKETVFRVDYKDLDDFISFHFSRQFDVIVDQEMRNHSVVEIEARKEALNEDEAADVENYRNGAKNYYMLNLLMQDLCCRGFIEPGRYYINISW